MRQLAKAFLALILPEDRLARVLTLIMFGVLLLSSIAWLSSDLYRPSQNWAVVGWRGGAVASLLTTIVYCWQIRRLRRISQRKPPRPSRWNYLMVPFIGLLGVSAFTYGLPSVLHHVSRWEDNVHTATIWGKDHNTTHRNRLRCEFELRLIDEQMPLGAFVCVPQALWDAAELRDKVKITSRDSYFALHIESVELLSEP